MLKLQLLILKNFKTESGFTMMEVLIAIIIALCFVAVSLQAMVLATAFRVKAQEKQVANQLIQQDIENINAIAGLVPANTSKCSAASYSYGYAKYLWDSYVSGTAYSSYSYQAVPSRYLLNNNQGKKLGLNRTINTNDNPPNQALRISYEVKELDSSNNFTGNAIATDYLEVIPNAALSCP